MSRTGHFGRLGVRMGLLMVLFGVGVSRGAEVDEGLVTPEIREVIQGGLRYLASEQSSDGSWAGIEIEERKHPVAITSYALLAFLSAGHLPGQGELGATVQAAADFLAGSTGADGMIGNRDDAQYMYGHGIATIALGEVYGETRDDDVKGALERAVRLIVSCQNQGGGWRYRPVVKDADISVTVLQLVALRGAKNAGIHVPQSVLDDGVRFVRSCYDARSGGFAYQPGREPGFARTAAALYSLQVCGLYDDPMALSASQYLFERFKVEDDWFTYGNFYAAPAQYMMGGEAWEKWYGMVSVPIVNAVSKVSPEMCYWNPWTAKLDRGKGGVGPIFSTSVYVMILAMPYNYLPLYQR